MGPQIFAAIVGSGLLAYSFNDLLRKHLRERQREELIAKKRELLSLYDALDESQERRKAISEKYEAALQRYKQLTSEHETSARVSYETPDGILTLNPRDKNSIRNFVEAMKERPGERQVVTR